MGDRHNTPVKPNHYSLDLTNLNFTTWTYSGTVSIDAKLTNPSNVIAINAHQLVFETAQLHFNEQVTTATSFDNDEKTQTVHITFEREVPAGANLTIVIAFQGELNDSLAGFYRSKYKPVVEQAASVPHDGDGSRYILSTQLAASYARRAFPCFDVPNLKATFALSIEVPSDQVALSNMSVKTVAPSPREGWNVVSFHTTPKMSTYLLAWAVGDFGYVEAFTEKGRKICVRVYAVRGQHEQGAFALGIAPRVLELYSALFDIPYPLDKMDILAVPEMTMTGMEHWGLVTAQPLELLFNEKTSTEAFKRGVVDNVCHELAHQWFGNLVTMDWWDELWLNEGFATWLGYYATNHLFPEWNIWAKFAVDRMEDAFSADGVRSSHPVHIPVSSGLETHQIFDQISYGKGCAVIRMLVEYVGADKFLQGTSNYLKAHAYGNATAHDLWSSLEEVSGKGVVDMAESWINMVGYPVISVNENTEQNKIVVRQSRFLTSGDVQPSDDTTIWRVPLGITGIEGGQDEFLSNKEQAIQGMSMDFYKVNNNGTGFYRVSYPPTRLAKLSKQLDRLSAEDKISIIGSASALASSGSSSVTSLLSFLQGFRRESNSVVWEQILEVLRTVDMVFSEDKDIRAGLKNFTLQLIENKVNEVGTEPLPQDDFVSRGLRRTLLAKAVQCGHESTINKFVPVFTEWAQNNTKIDPSMVRIVFRAAMQKDAMGTSSILKSKLADPSAPDELTGFVLFALAGADDKGILQDVVAYNWSPAVPLLRMQIVLFALVDHPVGRHIQWAYTRDNWEKCVAKVKDPQILDQFVQVTMQGFGSEEVIADMGAFFAGKDTEGFKQSLERGKENILARASYRRRDSESLKQWLVEEKYM